MAMLSDDDLNLRDMTDEELERAWDFWFDLAQTTNDWDPPYEHGVFVGMGAVPSSVPGPAPGTSDLPSLTPGGTAIRRHEHQP